MQLDSTLHSFKKKTMKPILLFLIFAGTFLCIKKPAFAYSKNAAIVIEKPIDGGYKNIATMKLKEFQRLVGRKLTFKEKVGFFVLKHRMKHQQNDTDKQGQTAYILGLVGLGLFVLGLFVPYVILGSLVAAIMAIVTGSTAKKKDGENRKAKAGKLLGWITLSLIVVTLILAVIVVASWGY